MDPSDFDPGPRSDVECIDDPEGPTLVFVRTLRHAPEKVWAALTEPDLLRQWAPYTADRNLATTGPATLQMLDDDPGERLPGEVSRVEPPSVLEYTWGTNLLRWQLEPVASGTRLTLRHSVESMEWMPKVAAGWHLCLVVAEHLLDGNPIGPVVGGDAMAYGWQDLNDAYAKELGIESTGPPDAVSSDG